MAVADAVSRLIPGVLPDPECFENESHWSGLLEYPQYSRPDDWHGMRSLKSSPPGTIRKSSYGGGSNLFCAPVSAAPISIRHLISPPKRTENYSGS